MAPRGGEGTLWPQVGGSRDYYSSRGGGGGTDPYGPKEGASRLGAIRGPH